MLNLRQDCDGKILGERSGSIRYSSHSLLFNRKTNESTEKLLDVSCTWIIDAHKNQTVWIDVISVGKGAIGIQFGNEDTLIYEKEQRALFSGTGRTIIEWSLRRTDKPFATLHLSKCNEVTCMMMFLDIVLKYVFLDTYHANSKYQKFVPVPCYSCKYHST